MGDKQLYLYPIWIRIWHGVNALSILILIITGISMQYSQLESPLISFEIAVKWHNFFGVLTAINYLFFFIANLVMGNSKQYKIKAKGLKDRLIKQSNYYISGYFKGEAKPFPISAEQKFNPLQKLAYVTTMYVFLPIVIISGVALLFPELIVERVLIWSGIEATALVHATFGLLLFLFLLVHLYVASIGKHPVKNYRSIISGYHHD